MLEKPNLSDERIVFALQEHFSLRVRAIKFLMFVMDSIFGDRMEGRAERLFFESYGQPEVDPAALAYYRYNWCVILNRNGGHADSCEH
jgi:hypothetical protein